MRSGPERHELLLTDDDGFPEALVSRVQQAVSNDMWVVCNSSEPLARRLSRAVDASPRLLPAPMPDLAANPVELLADALVLAAGHVDSGESILVINEGPVMARSAWWEWSRVEAARNLLMADVWQVCWYPAPWLDAEQRASMRATHPWECDGPGRRRSDTFLAPTEFLEARLADPYDHGLPDPLRVLDDPTEIQVRAVVREVAEGGGLAPDDVDSLVFAASEVTSNAHQHGAVPVSVRVWCGDRRVTVAVSDAGPGSTDALVGLTGHDPDSPSGGGTGLWLTHCMVDARHTRTAEGNTVYLSVGAR